MSSLLIRAEKLARALRVRAVRPNLVRRILVIHQLLLGDALLIAPLLKELARQYPEAERVVTVRPELMPLFESRPYGVRAMPLTRRDDESQRRLMDSGPYDLAIVIDDNRYAWLARAAGARWIAAFANDQPGWKNWMVDDAKPYPDHARAWADLLAPTFLGSRAEPFVLGEWPAPTRARQRVREDRYAVLHVGASSRLKAWQAEKWNAVSARLRDAGLQIIFTGAPGEAKWLEGINATEAELRHFGTLDLAELWHVLADARVLVCPDTGVAHLARLVGVPTIAMFGPGSALIHGAGEFWGASRFQAATVEDFPCRDQNRLYRRSIGWVRRCGRGIGEGSGQCPSALCMHALDTSKVLAPLELELASDGLIGQ
jgi:ADP-heptose:LPS heptosyltransferase